MSFDLSKMLGGMLNPENMLNMLAQMLSPTQRAVLLTLPKIAGTSLDLAKRPMPKFKMAAKPETKQIAVIYEFNTVEDMQAFYANELEVLKVFNAISNELGARNKDASSNQPAKS